MKKLIALLLAVVMVLGLVACSSSAAGVAVPLMRIISLNRVWTMVWMRPSASS